MSYINRRFSHEKRVVHLAVGDHTRTLSYNYFLNSGLAIGQSVILGPTPIFTRASDGRNFNEIGVFVIASGDEPRYDHDPVGNNDAFGLLMEKARTNEALHSADLSNAVWATIDTTGVKDAIGLDGVSNSASTLTADANDGTCFQTVTKASAANSYSVYVRRKTGTGTVEITDDGGTGFTDITSSINSSTYTRFSLEQTQADPEFGFRLGTSGDEIEVDGNQLEAGSADTSPTSYIPTTTASVDRAAEFCTTTDLSWLSTLDTHTFVMRYRKDNTFTNQSFINLDTGSGDVDYIKIIGRNFTRLEGHFRDSPGGQANFFTFTDVLSSNQKIATAIAEGDQASSLNGATVVTDTETGLIPNGDLTTFRVGNFVGADRQPNAWIRTIEYNNVRKSNAFLEGA